MGCARLGAFWQGNGLRDARRAVNLALDNGVRFIDTADVYARGLSERVIGSVARERRADMVVCTKVGQVKSPTSSVGDFIHPDGGGRRWERAARSARTTGDPDQVPRNWSGPYLEWAFAGSLRRLRTSYVDVLLLHSPSTSVMEERAWQPTAERLLRSGAVRAFGVSVDDPSAASAAIDCDLVSWIQAPVNAATYPLWTTPLEAAAGRGVSVIARSPFQVPADDHTADGAHRPTPQFIVERLRASSRLKGVKAVLCGMSSTGHVAQNTRHWAAATS